MSQQKPDHITLPAAHALGEEAQPQSQIPFSRPSSPVTPHDRWGVVGLGNMGAPMALNLAKTLKERGQPPLLVWNRSEDRVEKFKSMAEKESVPVQVAADLQEIGRTCDYILTSLGSDQAAIEVYAELFKGQETQSDKGDGIIPGGRGKSTIFIDTSTIYPTTTGKLERLASSRPARHFLACPVFGPPPAARSAQLLLVIAGNLHAKKHVAHTLVPAIGRKMMDFGSDVEKASKFKLIGNSMILGTIELLSEAMTLADRSGVGADKLYEYVQEFFPAPSFLGYSKKILENNFKGEEGFTLQGGIKDASHIRRLAEESSVPMPIIDVAHQHLITARANGGDQLDWSSLVGGQRIAAGLPPFEKKTTLERYE